MPEHGNPPEVNAPDGANISERAAIPERFYASEDMTKQEKRAFMFGAIKAALVMWAVIMGGIVLFILFCVFVWLR